MIEIQIPQIAESEKLEKPETTYGSVPLYHGAGEPFSFSREYQFEDMNNDGSFTLGEGMYLTNDPKHAADYSGKRQSDFEVDPIVYSIAAENCKFLDFRGESGNVPVEQEMIIKWKNYFKEDLERQKKETPDVGPESELIQDPNSTRVRRKINWAFFERQLQQQYLSYLEELVNEPKKIDLRELLGTAPPPDTKAEYRGNESGPHWSKLFRNFVVKELGYDGVVFLEGAEGKLAGMHPSFIVYNLEAIDVSEQPVPVDQL